MTRQELESRDLLLLRVARAKLAAEAAKVPGRVTHFSQEFSTNNLDYCESRCLHLVRTFMHSAVQCERNGSVDEDGISAEVNLAAAIFYEAVYNAIVAYRKECEVSA